MIVALYARVSTTKQAEKDLSIPDQLRQMREWCNSKDYKVAVEYVEPGASATDDRRPVFQQMITEACITPAPFDAIIVHSLSRFFRDSIEFGLYERKLKKYDVGLYSITQQTTDDPGGEMARKIFNVFDEYQSRENAKHTLRAMKENARQGFFNGSHPPFGYRKIDVLAKGRRENKKRLEIDPSEAAIVCKIFDLYLNRNGKKLLGMKGIACYLNEQGITRRGRKWSRTAVNKILGDKVYVGEYYFNKTEAKTRKIKPESEWVRIKIDPIIDIETFERAHQLRRYRSPSNLPPRVVNSPTLLTGLLKCGLCGSRMTTATGKGGRYKYYKCTNKINKGKSECSNKQARLKKGHASTGNQLKALTKELNKIDQKLQRLYDAYENGFLPMDVTLKERAQSHKARREEILIEMARLRQRNEMPLSKFGIKQIVAFCKTLKERFRDRSSNFGKEYLRLLIDEIKFAGQEVVIRGNYEIIPEAMQKTKPSTLQRVPGFGIGWLPSTDSNRGLSG